MSRDGKSYQTDKTADGPKGGLERWDATPLTEARVFESSAAFLIWL